MNNENRNSQKSKTLNSPHPPVSQRSEREKETLASNTLNLENSKSGTPNSGVKGSNLSSRRRWFLCKLTLFLEFLFKTMLSLTLPRLKIKKIYP